LIALSMSAAFTFQSANGGAMQFAFKWLSLPFLTFWLIIAFRTEVLGKGTAQKVASAIILTACLCSIGSGGLMWLNAYMGEQKTVVVSGVVVSRNSGGIKGYPTITVQDERTLGTIRLEVSKRQYEATQVGGIYQRQMRIGLLGIMYSPAR
jgi:hypothetical protein